jgi:hypothetical protein
VPKDLTGYSYKSISFAMKELAAQLGEKEIILGYVPKLSAIPRVSPSSITFTRALSEETG